MSADGWQKREWSGAGLNRRHTDFQSVALPTELPNQKYRFLQCFLGFQELSRVGLRFFITPDVTPAKSELGCSMLKILEKPSPDFPLTPHASGYWVKKIKGRTHYIGARGATPAQALDEWKRVKDSLLSGEPVKPT